MTSEETDVSPHRGPGRISSDFLGQASWRRWCTSQAYHSSQVLTPRREGWGLGLDYSLSSHFQSGPFLEAAGLQQHLPQIEEWGSKKCPAHPSCLTSNMALQNIMIANLAIVPPPKRHMLPASHKQWNPHIKRQAVTLRQEYHGSARKNRGFPGITLKPPCASGNYG